MPCLDLKDPLTEPLLVHLEHEKILEQMIGGHYAMTGTNGREAGKNAMGIRGEFSRNDSKLFEKNVEKGVKGMKSSPQTKSR